MEQIWLGFFPPHFLYIVWCFKKDLYQHPAAQLINKQIMFKRKRIGVLYSSLFTYLYITTLNCEETVYYMYSVEMLLNVSCYILCKTMSYCWVKNKIVMFVLSDNYLKVHIYSYCCWSMLLHVIELSVEVLLPKIWKIACFFFDIPFKYSIVKNYSFIFCRNCSTKTVFTFYLTTNEFFFGHIQ